MNTEQKKGIRKFFSEMQVLKRIKHEGWRLAGIEHPDSIADHALCAAQIAYVLGRLEGADAAKCAVMSLFHDNEETRVGDHHKVAARYLEWKTGSLVAMKEHFKSLPAKIADDIIALMVEEGTRSAKEGVIAKDADWLEVAIQGKIYLEAGHKGALDWILNVEKALETKSAKAILKIIKNDPDFTNSWWRGLKKMTHKKLKK